jgi:hypothetical protein
MKAIQARYVLGRSAQAATQSKYATSWFVAK